MRGLMAALTLPKAARLHKRSEFAAVRECGRAWHGKFMVMGVWQTDGADPARLGVVTGRKVGGAVVRNALRRRLREIFRLHRALLPAGLWMVVVLRRAAGGESFHSLADEWLQLSRRAGLPTA